MESVNIGRETDRVMGLIRETKVYEIEARAFELLIVSSKIAWEMSVSLGITMSRSTKESVYTYLLCLIRQLSEWRKSKVNYNLHKAMWNSPVLARCLEVKINIS